MSLAPHGPAARGFGYLPDRPDPRDRPVKDLVAVRGVRMDPNHRPFRTSRLLQGGAGACFAFAAARAIHIGLQIQGDRNPPIPSPAFIYWNARAQAYKARPEAERPVLLDDTGTRPREGMQAIRGCGFAPWDAAPYDPRDVRTRPPRAAYMRAFDQRGLSFYRIDESNRVNEIAAAMAAGASVILCMQVDTPFLWNHGDVIRDVDLQHVEGGHAMTVLDLTRGTVDVDNWWDDWGEPHEQWAEGGTGRLAVDLVNYHPSVVDVYAVLSVPIYTEAA